MKTNPLLFTLVVLSIVTMDRARAQVTVGTGLTYQGQLRQDGAALSEFVDFEFRLFTLPEGGTQVGPTAVRPFTLVENGLFSTLLDFGNSAFNGDARFLEISARNPAGSGEFVVLDPRQAITAAPYAVRANRSNAAFALDAPDGSPTNAVFVNNSGNVGVGTSNPEIKLHVTGGNDSGLAGGGFIQAGTAGSNIAIDDNEIMARSNGGPSGLFLNHEGGNVLIAGLSASGSVGIGTVSPQGRLHVKGQPGPAGGTLALEGDNHTYMGFFPNGVGAGRKGWFGFGFPGGSTMAMANDAGGEIQFWTHGQAQLWVDSSGIGIPNMPYIGDFYNVQWHPGGRLGYDNSTRRHKENIRPLVTDFERLLDAQPVTYTRPGNPDRWEVGYIAEDMNDLGLTPLIYYEEDGLVGGFNYEKSLIYLVEIAKAQRDKIAAQATQIAESEKTLRDLTSRLEALEAKLTR